MPGAVAALAALAATIGAFPASVLAATAGSALAARLAVASGSVAAGFARFAARFAAGFSARAAFVAAAPAVGVRVQAVGIGITRNARVPLCPPNPIEFESAPVTRTVRA